MGLRFVKIVKRIIHTNTHAQHRHTYTESQTHKKHCIAEPQDTERRETQKHNKHQHAERITHRIIKIRKHITQKHKHTHNAEPPTKTKSHTINHTNTHTNTHTHTRTHTNTHKHTHTHTQTRRITDTQKYIAS